MPQLIANIGSRQALIDDVLVGSKVRYLSNFSVAPHFGERPESVHPGRSSAAGRPTVHHESRSVRPQLGDLDMVIGRFRFVVIAVAVVIIAGFAVLGAQIWLMNARIDQLATKVSGIDATFGVKLEETNAKLDAASAKLDAISQRLPAEFKTIGAEIAAQTSAIAKGIASLRGLAPSPPTSLLPEPATGPKPASPPARPVNPK